MNGHPSSFHSPRVFSTGLALIAAGLSVPAATTLPTDSAGPPPHGSRAFYVDPARGNDHNDGALATPFRTLSPALAVVDGRVRQGLRSDKIYLRAGVYRNELPVTKWRLNLRGTPEDFALLSAMPAEPHAPGAVQRKSGAWYERVVFDDAQRIATPWTRVTGRPGIWQTKPGFVRLEWTHANLWPWSVKDVPRTPDDATPLTTLFTVAPYMLLQDDQPLLWADTLDALTEPGHRTYNQETETLFVRPRGDQDPNTCVFESWYGGPEPNGELLLLDGEGRGLFDGDLHYAALRGCEFRMFTKIFESHRRKYDREAERVVQRHVTFEDNFCRDGWMHILLDGTQIFDRENGQVTPRYSDRSDWLVRNNLFLRPAREVFQVHGDNHVFEHNDILHHGGPWAGPAAIVSVLNARNSANIKVRFNYIEGQGDNRWHAGSVFMLEVGRDQADASGDCRCGGQAYEYNLFANLTSGAAIYLGKGACRLTNITIRGNIFAGHRQGPAIRFGSPLANVRIEHNLFYKLKTAFDELKNSPEGSFADRPSTGYIRHNIFVENGTTLTPSLEAFARAGMFVIDQNQFFANGNAPAGTNAITTAPVFRNPATYDFRSRPDQPAVAGPYVASGDIPPGIEWWLRKRAAESLSR
ncbi:MAG: right-handed parallel beta-helix repeat-containing protein [Opitutaceae bacterium]|nr:right-handed parallel beta-helix repeat-containing protein [Opitutaceae bacterium]